MEFTRREENRSPPLQRPNNLDSGPSVQMPPINLDSGPSVQMPPINLDSGSSVQLPPISLDSGSSVQLPPINLESEGLRDLKRQFSHAPFAGRIIFYKNRCIYMSVCPPICVSYEPFLGDEGARS